MVITFIISILLDLDLGGRGAVAARLNDFLVDADDAADTAINMGVTVAAEGKAVVVKIDTDHMGIVLDAIKAVNDESTRDVVKLTGTIINDGPLIPVVDVHMAPAAR